MKPILLLMLIIVMVSAVHAQLPEQPYIGLFAGEDRTSSCVTGTGFYQVEMWIWCLSSDGGQMCAEFAIQYPSNVIWSTVTNNDPIISVMLGGLPDAVSVCYNECQYDWIWPFHQRLYVTDSEPSWVEIIAHPEAGQVQFANCSP